MASALNDTIAQVKKLADLVEANPGKYTDVLDKAQGSVQDVAALLGKLKAGDVASVREALTQWDDVNELLADSAKQDATNAHPGITADEILTDAGKVLGVAAKVAPLILEFGPLFGI